MVHRGPDDGGEYFDDEQGLGMGFRRLSVIDLSAAGHQPMANEDGTIWLAFNGEIYNFQELRRDLLASGHAFRSRTDSEVILHQYEESGMRCTDYLNGMFAFALWDRRSRRLLLARDRLGKKPLYYYDDGKRLIYASELKAILVNRIVPRDLDGDALGEYLSRGYVSAPRTIFRSVQQLLPAHWMVFENGESKAERYWDWLPAFRSDQTLTEEEWTQKVQSILKTVVRERLNSDVSLGAFLSGGIDSSAVVATMAHLGHQPIRTFSIGFRDQDYDELPYARMVAKQFATDHHEFYLEPESVRELLPRLINQFDEPLADASALPTYYLSKVARREVTVCLSGDGGDEACAGHDRYVQSFREQTVDCVPMALRRLLLAPARILPWGVPGRRLASRLALGPVQRYVSAVTHIPQELLTQLLTPEASRWIGVSAIRNRFWSRSGAVSSLFSGWEAAHSVDGSPVVTGKAGIVFTLSLTSAEESQETDSPDGLSVMRILMLASPPGIRGPIPKLTPVLLAALQSLGCTTDFIPWGRLQEHEGVLPKVLGRLRAIGQAWTMLRSSRFDVAIVHTGHDWRTLSRDICLLFAIRRLCRHIVLQFHGSAVDRLVGVGGHAFKFLSGLVVRLGDATLVLSSEELKQWKAFYPSGDFHLVRNPFLVPYLEPSVSPTPPENRIPVLLYVGRLVRQKGLFELIEATAEVRQRIEFRLVLVGDGLAGDSLRAKVQERGLQAHVWFRGYLLGEDLWNAYRSADAFVLPTWREGFPYAIMEAMHTGLPIVTTRMRGMADHLQEGINALFVEPRNPSDLARALLEILSNDELRRRMRKSNQASLLSFDPKLVATQYLSVLQLICLKS